MTAHDPSAFLKIDTPSNACTVTDRALREAFRASMDAPQEKAGLLDQLNARIAALKSTPKAAPPMEAAPAKAEAAAPVEAPAKDKPPQDEEGSLFAHLNEIMEEKAVIEAAEDDPEGENAPRSKSVIVRTFQSLMPKRKIKADPAPTPKPAPEKAASGSIVLGLLARLKPAKAAKAEPASVEVIAPVSEKAPSKSIIIRALSSLKPKAKAKVEKPAKEPSGSVVLAILKALSPIKRSS